VNRFHPRDELILLDVAGVHIALCDDGIHLDIVADDSDALADAYPMLVLRRDVLAAELRRQRDAVARQTETVTP
jgi:hypothetical protein